MIKIVKSKKDTDETSLKIFSRPHTDRSFTTKETGNNHNLSKPS